MRVTLKLRFSTQFGQTVWVAGNHPVLGGGDPKRALPLQYLDRDYWQITIELGNAADLPQQGAGYYYLLRQSDGTTIADWEDGRALRPALLGPGTTLIVDAWNAAGFPENTFYTEPFRNVLLADRQASFCPPATARFTHVFRVQAPLLEKGQTLALVGGAAALGQWVTAHAVRLERQPGERFLTARVNLEAACFPLEYKYGVYDIERRQFLGFEGGNNRRLVDAPEPGRQVVLNDGFAVLPVETWKGAGVAIPVFSLRTESSFGIGEFSDLEVLADWCRDTGLKLIQILPVNDTTATHTWVDSYPYAAISAFALHPIYLNLGRVASPRNRALLAELEAERQRLNALPEVDWAAVLRAKLAFLRRLYPSQKAATFRSAAYRDFYSQNQHWLLPYAAFCHLRDRFGTADASGWPAHQRYDADAISAMAAPGASDEDALRFHYFIQFHLHTQLRQAVAHAHQNSVVLKGDIAIGVARHGADTWQDPSLYDLSMQAGAPPDAFAARGQNWGFPTYNWPEMMRHGFRWWKQRFAQMGAYFDAFRIDHILGFFRIWSVPIPAVEGILGHFVPALPVEVQEFARRGLSFDRERWVKPFITDDVLAEVCPGDETRLKQTFLVATGHGQYALRPEFTTQRQIEKCFAARPPAPEDPASEEAAAAGRLRQGLFDLTSNVILLETEAEGRTSLHFRFDMEKTASFRALDEPTRGRLREMYVDYFYRRQDSFWRDRALEKLPALKQVTDMLICGEDLGAVPACVPGVMRDLGLLSLEIQRMPKTPGETFFRPAKAPYLSVVTPSTHDMSTIRGWWTEDRELTRRFYREELGLTGEAPVTCSGPLNEAVVRQHLASPAMWSIFQLQDLLGMDEVLRRANPEEERINVPAIPQFRWRYRLHLSLESLRQAAAFNAHLQSLLQQYQR